MIKWRLSGTGLVIQRGVAVALLVLIGLAVVAEPAAAAPTAPETASLVQAAVPCCLMADFTNEVLGNRSRMIQVACVVVAIGIFILSRSIK